MKKDLLIFIHGLGGHYKKTWGKFPSLVQEDKDLANYDVGYYSYPTSLVRWPWMKKSQSIHTLAKALRTTINFKFRDYANIALVCHSLGGMIARKYLLEEVQDNKELRVKRLILFAVPNNGSSMAKLADTISFGHRHLKQLFKNSDIIQDLNEDWFTFKLDKKLSIRYVLAGLDGVVTEQSAQMYWGNKKVEVVNDKNHRSLVKPNDSGDMPYLILKDTLRRGIADEGIHASIAPYETPSLNRFEGRGGNQKLKTGQYKVIGFDLDGTLLRGQEFEFSWTLVWDHLGFPKKVRKEGMRRYLSGETTYAAWCEWACQQFRIKKLHRNQFKEMAQKLTVTKNLVQTLETLRSDGAILAVVSGGIDVFIREKIPNAEELFDYIFINKLKFDDDGIVDGVEVTPFDFGGKATALEKIAIEHGYTMDNVAFIGEGFNDTAVSKKAGKSIAYPPTSQEMEQTTDIQIKEDNLSLILDYVYQ